MKNDLTQEMLKELLHYNPDTGIFTWTDKVRNKNRKGAIAGSVYSKGYLMIKVNNQWNKNRYLAHRLAFLYMEGYFPENDIDHINRIPLDNRWCNLREVSKSCNAKNKDILPNNTSGITGVTKYNDKGVVSYRASIQIGLKQIKLKRRKTFSEAVKDRHDAEIKYEYQNCNTTSSAYLYLKENAPELLAS